MKNRKEEKKERERRKKERKRVPKSESRRAGAIRSQALWPVPTSADLSLGEVSAGWLPPSAHPSATLGPRTQLYERWRGEEGRGEVEERREERRVGDRRGTQSTGEM